MSRKGQITITSVANTAKYFFKNSIGSYVASGIPSIELNPNNTSTYGFNSLLAPAAFKIQYNDIPFIELISNVNDQTIVDNRLTFYSSSKEGQGHRAMELTNSALTFYGISIDGLPTASLGNNSLDFYGYSLTNDETVGEKTYYTKTYNDSTPIYTEVTLEPGANPAVLGLYTYGVVSSFGQSSAEIGGFTIENNLLKLDAQYQLDNNTSVMTERIRFGFLNSHIGENAKGQSDSSSEQEIDDDETTNTIEEDEFGLEIYTPLTAGYILTTDETLTEGKDYYILNKEQEGQEKSYAEVSAIKVVWLESYSNSDLVTYIQTSDTAIVPEQKYYNGNQVLRNPNTLNWKEYIEEDIIIEDNSIIEIDITGGSKRVIRLSDPVFTMWSISINGTDQLDWNIITRTEGSVSEEGIDTRTQVSYWDVSDVTLKNNDTVEIKYYSNSVDTTFNLTKNYYNYENSIYNLINLNDINPNNESWFIAQNLTWNDATNDPLPTKTGSEWSYKYIFTNYKITLLNGSIVYYENPTLYATLDGPISNSEVENEVITNSNENEEATSDEDKDIIITEVNPRLIGLYEANNTIISQPVFHVDSTNSLTIGYGDKTVTWDNGELSIQADNIYAYQNGSRINILEILTELQELGSQSEGALLDLQEDITSTTLNLTEAINNLANSATQDYVDSKLLDITNSITNNENNIRNIQNDMVVTNTFFENLNSYIEIDTVNNIFSLKNANSSISQAINFGKDNISIESDLSSHPILRINDDNMVQTDYLILGGFEEDTENTESNEGNEGNESNEDTENTASGFRWQYDYSDNTLRLKEL